MMKFKYQTSPSTEKTGQMLSVYHEIGSCTQGRKTALSELLVVSGLCLSDRSQTHDLY